MAGYSSCSSGAKHVRVAKIFKPSTTFAIRWFKNAIVTINEVKKTSILEIRHLKHHLPFVDDAITLYFFAEVL